MQNMVGGKQRKRHEPDRSQTAPSLGSERLALIFESAPIMMHSIDKGGRIVAVNREWLTRLGYERNEVLGKKSIDFLTDTSRARATTGALPLFWQTGSARSVGLRLLSKAGVHVDLLLDAVTCPPAMEPSVAIAALYEPEDPVQWRAASVTLQEFPQPTLEPEKPASGGPAQEGSALRAAPSPDI